MAYYQLVQVDDFGIGGGAFTAFAEAVVSGGDIVQCTSTNTGVVGSARNTLVWTDIHVQKAAEIVANGIALTTQGTISGPVAVATKGLYILPVGSKPISAGSAVMASGYGNMVETCPAESGGHIIGRALTTGSFGEFAVVSLSC